MNSMTGFGRAEGSVGGFSVVIEIKSVNHRYLDARFRLPPLFQSFEVSLLESLKTLFERGSFDISIRYKSVACDNLTSQNRFAVDKLALESFLESVQWVKKKYKLKDEPILQPMVMTGKVFIVQDEVTDAPALWGPLKKVFDAALKDVEEMRKREGEKLRKCLKEELAQISASHQRLSPLAKDQPQSIQAKLMEQLKKWELSSRVDRERLEWEVAFFAERADITEEIARLSAHLEELGHLIEQKKSVGRKLDFLTQELHREANTIASKAQSLKLTQTVVEMKTHIEKLREQIQNVE